ncbi:PKD domain-containing protein [Candidatus Pacearchaeota archaeon]|nr:MAG: PKD domain-containing protein [Candidatus Pacearchaeota archaeon]
MAKKCLGKLLLLSVSFVLLVLALTASSHAEFSVDENSTTIVKQYDSGDKIKGTLNITFDEEPDGNFSSSFNQTSISLVELLGRMGYSRGEEFSCIPKSCKVSHVKDPTEAGETSASFPLLSEATYGFELSGEDVHVIDARFSVHSNAHASCVNQLQFDLLDDGSIDFFNPNFLPTVACSEKNFGCFDPDEAEGSVVVSKGEMYCQKFELPPAPAYKIGAVLQNDEGFPDTSDKISMVVFDSTFSRMLEFFVPSLNTTSPGFSFHPTKSDEGRLVVPLVSIKNTTQVYVCIYKAATGGNETTYKIRYETTGERCGGKGGSVYSPTSDNLTDVDYEMYVQKMKYAPLDPYQIIYDDELYHKATGSVKKLARVFDDYIEEVYERNCTTNCYIPVHFKGLRQDITIEDVRIEYTTKIGSFIADKTYPLLKLKPRVSSPYITLDLEKLDFETPDVNGTREFKIYLNDREVVSEEINIHKAFDFSIGPEFARVGLSVVFRIIDSDKNVSSTEWNFGDGTPTQQVDGTSVSHVFTNSSIYNVTVSATATDGEVSTKTFEIVAGEARESANLLLDTYTKRANEFKTKFDSFPTWIKNEIKKKADIESILSELQRQRVKLTDLGNNSDEEEYVKIIDALLELDIPRDIASSESGTLNPAAQYNFIDPNLVAEISGVDASSINAEDVKNKILDWVLNNYDVQTEFSSVEIVTDSATEPVLKKYKVVASKKADAESANVYLIVRYPKENVVFKDSSATPVSLAGGQAFAMKLTQDSQTIEFFIRDTSGSTSALSLPMFVAPELSALQLASTQPPELVRPEGFKWGRFIIGMIFVLIVVFAIYIALQYWYKYNYENSLFKNKDDLYNMLNFIYNSRRAGLSDKEIRAKLKGMGWKGEQITYALKKIDGKRTGLWEIPLLSFWEKKKTRKELEKRQGGPIDKRFLSSNAGVSGSLQSPGASRALGGVGRPGPSRSSSPPGLPPRQPPRKP